MLLTNFISTVSSCRTKEVISNFKIALFIFIRNCWGNFAKKKIMSHEDDDRFKLFYFVYVLVLMNPKCCILKNTYVILGVFIIHNISLKTHVARYISLFSSGIEENLFTCVLGCVYGHILKEKFLKKVIKKVPLIALGLA